jgi:hypothetical protein
MSLSGGACQVLPATAASGSANGRIDGVRWSYAGAVDFNRSRIGLDSVRHDLPSTSSEPHANFGNPRQQSLAHPGQEAADKGTAG